MIQSRPNNVMHAKPGLRVFLKWVIAASGSVITAVICFTMNKNIPIGCAVVALIVGAFAFYVISKIPAFPDTSATPEQGFAHLCGLELPDTISDIECHGAVWMDHSLAIRFIASEPEIEKILGSDFIETSWETVRARFAAPPCLDDFEGRWSPDRIANRACYSRTSSSADYIDESILVIDHENGLVYGISEGSVQ